jgi:hypothetical protein
MVSTLAMHNTATVRTRMKSAGLFDARDRAVARCLTEGPQFLLEALQAGLSVDSLCEQPRLRDTLVVALLAALHDPALDSLARVRCLVHSRSILTPGCRLPWSCCFERWPRPRMWRVRWADVSRSQLS